MSLAQELLNSLPEGKMFDNKEEYLKMLRRSLGSDADLIDKHRSFVDKSFDLDVSIPDLTRELKAKKGESIKESSNKDWFAKYKSLYSQVNTSIEDEKDKSIKDKFSKFEDPFTNGFDDLMDYEGEYKDLLDLQKRIK